MRLLSGISSALNPLAKAYNCWVASTYPFAQVGRALSIHFSADLSRGTARWMQIGNSVRIDKGAWVYVSLAEQLVSGGPALIIDDNVLIARHCQVAARKRIHIESDVTLSASVLIVDHLHQYEDIHAPISKQGLTDGGSIRIGEGCWIGHGAAIVCDKGELVLGRNCVVAANALVTRSFPAHCVVAGNPARIIRQYDFEKGEWVMGTARAAGAEKEPISNTDVKGAARCAASLGN